MAHNRSDIPDDDQSGFSILNNAATNRSVAFNREERERYGLRGLLPARVFTQAEQMDRVLNNLKRNFLLPHVPVKQNCFPPKHVETLCQ